MNLLLYLKKHFHNKLQEDTEYIVSLTPKTPLRNFKRYIRFRIKQILPPKAVEQIRSLLWYLYFTCHYFRPRHIYQYFLFSLKKERYIALYGGFGDLLMLLPFFKLYAQKHNQFNIILVYNDTRLNKFKETSYWPSLHFKISSGKEIVPIKDFLSNIPYLKKIIPGDIWDNGYDCWHAPHIAKRLKGSFFKPSEYKECFNEIFSNEDISFADFFFREKNLDKFFLITLHFRSSAEKIKQLYSLISQDEQMYSHSRFLLLGNLEHNVKGDPTHLIDLRNNYEKGINIRQLLAVAKKSNLYLGGRGGFDLFFWLAQVPTLNIFDLQGKGELEKMWPSFLWEQNYFKELYWQDSFNSEKVFSKTIRPYFQNWLQEQKL